MLFGKTILITGVSSGIGARTAELAGQLGADVVGVDANAPSLPMASFVQADISSPEGIAQLVARLPDRIDALANVAGVSGTTGAAKTLAINFYGLRALSEAVAPRIREGGAIVNVASIAGYGWRTNLERTKGLVGVQGFPDTEAVAKEFGVGAQDCYPITKERCCSGPNAPLISHCSNSAACASTR